MNNGQELYLTEYPPRDTPVHFKPELIPEGQLAHAGVFTPDQNEYYYTLSDASFSQFTVMFITNLADQWTAPKEAFFNSSYLEHGVHFTADGQWVYFSSTRPVEKEEFSSVWHIWRSKKLENGWSDPEWVAIPGMETKSTSHPSLVRSGRMYFHSSNPDFSDMALYVTEPAMGVFTKAKKIVFPEGANHNTFTPFVAQDESYILFGKKFDDFREHELYISFRDQNAWQVPRRLHDNINTNNLGNPYVTPDGQYLFYASGHWSLNAPPYDWVIKWVSTKSVFAQ
ncbi:MAG: hypothetical protein O7G85_08365 [Planctomycetota bacterium]|nr:hypothetical protein [Planctomycetota bacterium]